ncbi:unnamed protein product [Echinostoma caproni]|uniref:PB1 domain-containing protein n=1 Tax=Echinostoma caproni TaxID=27848 RepID=A0A183A041_9TREM|nr:unnamed protein product [Echinostoma caproni]
MYVVDGEDYCTIRDVNDLEEAVQCMESGECGSKVCRIYASPDKTAHHTIFGIKPTADPEDVKELPKIDELDLNSENTATEEQPGPGSNWEVLDLGSDFKPGESSAEEVSTDEPEVHEEEKHSEEEAVPVPIPSTAAPIPAEATSTTTLEPAEAVAVDVSSAPSDTPAVAAAVAAAATAPVPAVPVASAPVPAPTPAAAVMPPQASPFYPGMYGMGQYYMHPGAAPAMPAMYAPQWPVTQMTPMMYPGMDYSPMQPASQNVPSAPVLSQQLQPQSTPIAPTPAAAPEAKAVDPSLMNLQSKLRNLKCVQPSAVNPDCRKKDKCSKSHYMVMCMTTLRSMGYTQDEKTLRHLIRKNRGNLNEILDELNRSTGTA